MIFTLIIALLFCIISHELAHALASKLCKVRITTVSIGFGKPSFSFKIRRTIFRITPWLLGGYVELYGEREYIQDYYSFSNKPYLQKCLIALAGVIINILIGLLFLGLGRLIWNEYLWYFGAINLALGLFNTLPFPGLDGSFPVFIPIYNLKFGKKEGYNKFMKLAMKGQKFLIWLNFLSIPLLIWWWIR